MRVCTDLQNLPAFRQTVITIGSFDGVHQGHQRILERVCETAVGMGLESVVITFDPHPRTILQPNDKLQLISTTEEKTRLLAKSGIDYVVVVPFTPEFSRLSAQEYVEQFLIRYFDPALIVIGYDHRFGHDREGDIHFLRSWSPRFEVAEIPVQEVDDLAVSSSKVRKALEQSDIRLAKRLLGHPYELSGRVVEGDKIGRTIGFPTANLDIQDPYKLLIPPGIYAAQTRLIGDRLFNAMLYIGYRPTLEGAQQKRIELNIIDFEGDLYGQDLRVEVTDFIRPDKTLDSLDALQAQIALDKIAILNSFEQQQSATQESEKSPKIAVVILNYNTRQHLVQYLPSVLKYSAEAHIIIADNGSPDDSLAWLSEHHPSIEVIDLQQNSGFAAGYNKALDIVQDRYGAGYWDYYVLLNSDVEVTKDWIGPVVAAMQAQPLIAIAQPKILAEQQRHKFEHAGAAGGWMDALGYPFCRGRIFTAVEDDEGQYDTAQSCFWAGGAAFFVRADLYHSFGGFDADYFAHNEEIDLCWRVKRAGYEVWCIPASKVYHLGGGTLGYESPRKVYLNFRNSLFSLLKNERAGKLLWLIPMRLVLDGVAAGMFAAKRQWPAIKAILQAHFSFYGAIGATFHKRKQVASLVKQHQIAPNTTQTGTFRGSIVWAHYIRRIKKFIALSIHS